ncbi:MAG: hypothetical protein ABI333_11370 [bacterium]
MRPPIFHSLLVGTALAAGCASAGIPADAHAQLLACEDGSSAACGKLSQHRE